jgi:hypothetical protein
MSTMTMLDYIDQEQETLTKIFTEYDFSADTQLAEMNDQAPIMIEIIGFFNCNRDIRQCFKRELC